MKKAIAIAGLAALIAGASCFSETKGKPIINENASTNNACSVNGIGYCSPSQYMFAGSESVEELAPENFDSTVLENKLPVVVKFYAEWCPPCRNFKPIFEKVCAEYEGRLVCAAYNTDQENGEGGIMGRYGVNRIPTTGFFNGGNAETERWFVGGKPENVLRTLFDEFLKGCRE
ncbi:MAG: thioredoxin domain-containing protein [Candidatus Nanoarchaeia archaeon]|nr:thioredoxin domain-containing protein [Candidatus Nanoarchaeia archaeon]